MTNLVKHDLFSNDYASIFYYYTTSCLDELFTLLSLHSFKEFVSVVEKERLQASLNRRPSTKSVNSWAMRSFLSQLSNLVVIAFSEEKAAVLALGVERRTNMSKWLSSLSWRVTTTKRPYVLNLSWPYEPFFGILHGKAHTHLLPSIYHSLHGLLQLIFNLTPALHLHLILGKVLVLSLIISPN